MDRMNQRKKRSPKKSTTKSPPKKQSKRGSRSKSARSTTGDSATSASVRGQSHNKVASSKTTASPLIRLQKVLAESGVGSRRECEELITEGRVDVDGKIVTELGTKVDPGQQTLRVDGIPLKRKRRVYFAVHKPPGVLSTSKDQWRRARVIDLVAAKERIFTVGRLDKESSGLILVTNDGDLANRLTHPRYGIRKTYQVTVAGTPKSETLQKLRRGVVLAEGRVQAESITIKKRLKQSTILEIVLAEGRNREIRRMLARFDHKVLQLRRTAMGSIRLGKLPLGAHRELTRSEVQDLRRLAEEEGSSTKPRRGRKGASTVKSKRSGSKPGKASAGKTGKKSAGKKSASKKGFGKKSTAGKKTAKRTTRKQSEGFDFLPHPSDSPRGGAVIGGSSERPKRKTTSKRRGRSPR